MTCTYEVYDIDREPVGHKIDRISTSLFSPFLPSFKNAICIFLRLQMPKSYQKNLSVHSRMSIDGQLAYLSELVKKR